MSIAKLEEVTAVIENLKHINLSATESGLYFLFLKGYLLYIGKSERVCRRVADHKDRFSFDSIMYINVPTEKLSKLEEVYIAKFNPPKNVENYEKVGEGLYIKRRKRRRFKS